MQENDVVSIVNVQYQKVLEANGSKAVQMGSYHGANQEWRFKPADSGFKTGWLENVASGKVLDANKDGVSKDGCRVQQWSKLVNSDADWQKWTISEESDGSVTITNHAGDLLVLDANKDEAGKNGCKVQLWTKYDPSEAQQQWTITPTGTTDWKKGGHFWLENNWLEKDKGRLVLDVDQGGIENDGAKVQLWEKHDDKKQQWRIEAVTDDKYRLVNLETNNVLDADQGNVGTDGCKVQQSKDSNNSNQHWTFEEVGNGQYLLRCAASDKVLDSDGSKVQLWSHHSGNNQHWELLLIVPSVA